MISTLRLGWFSTGRGEGSRGLLESTLEAIDSGRLNARIEFVFCNRETGQAAGSDDYIELVKSREIPLVTLSSQRFRREHGNAPWATLREDYDRAAIERLQGFAPDLAVNAGYMLIAPLLCRRFRMLNLHPALPGGPVGTWQQVIWQLIEKHAAVTGAMVHEVTEEVDEGPVISYCRFRITGDKFDPLWSIVARTGLTEAKLILGEQLPLFIAIRQEGLRRERPLLVQTLKSVADRRINLDGVTAAGPLDLTDQVEAAVGKS